MDCIKYFRGNDDDVKYVYINGLIKFSDLEKDDKFKKDNDKEYIDHLKKFLNDYEIKLRKKKGRKSLKKINEENFGSNY